jgi:hypothetical protein
MKYFDCRRTLELAGPAFMKWGQWASTRADIFPPDMCTELAKLQSSAPAHSYRRTAAIVESALGQPISLLFDRYVTCLSSLGLAVDVDVVRRSDMDRLSPCTSAWCVT